MSQGFFKFFFCFLFCLILLYWGAAGYLAYRAVSSDAAGDLSKIITGIIAEQAKKYEGNK